MNDAYDLNRRDRKPLTRDEVFPVVGQVERLRADIERLRADIERLRALLRDAWTCATNEDIGAPFFEETAAAVKAELAKGEQ